MMKKIILSSVSILSVLCANIVFANNNYTLSDYQASAYYQYQLNKKHAYNSKIGFTIGLNAGYAKVNAFTTTNNTGFAWNGNLGYQFNPYFAIESGYTAFPDVNETGTLLGVGGYTATDKYYGIDFLFKPIWPVTQHFNLFAKVGAMYLTAIRDLKTTTAPLQNYSRLQHIVTQFNPEVGIGASYDFTPHFALSIQGISTFYGYTTYAGYGGVIFKFN